MRTGLFLSRDDGRISEAIDVDSLARHFAHLPVARVYDNFFRYSDHQDILHAVDAHGLDAVVLAGDSPKYFDAVRDGRLILAALKGCGINENKIAFANIKEQAALAHRGAIGTVTKKAQLLIDVALAKVEMCHDVSSLPVAPRRSVLVIGTTPGGIVAARQLLAKDYRVYLVEREAAIRGHAGMEAAVLPSLTGVQLSDRAAILLGTEIEDISGWCGDYRVVLATEAGHREIKVGGIILSVGNDTEWIRVLKPKMQLDTDREGLLLGQQKSSLIGETREPGIWFIPYSEGGDSLAAQASAASVAVVSLTTLLDRNEIEHSVLISEVDEAVCGGCGTCVKTCAFSASSMDLTRKLSVIDSTRCKGCGNCVVACPTGARDLVSYPERFVVEAINIMSQGGLEDADPKVLAILCNGCGYLAADAAGTLANEAPELRYSTNVMPLQVECGGNIDTVYILEAFNRGFAGVALTVCPDGRCYHVVGNTDMERRIGLFREVLRSRHIDAERLRVIHVSPHDGELFSREIRSFCGELTPVRREDGRP
jgi:heterodisulfide reductase subunit A-like polyferredoxin/coenzyme F420-reducing hydrogenase delta subunit